MFSEITKLFCYRETLRNIKLVDKLLDDTRERIIDLQQKRCSEFGEGYLQCLRKEHNDLLQLKEQINNN
jgi:hypothetical protein